MNKRFSTQVALVLISTSTMMLGCYRQPREDEQQNGTTSTGHSGVHYYGTPYYGSGSSVNSGATHTSGRSVTGGTTHTGGSSVIGGATHTTGTSGTASTSSSVRSGFGASSHAGTTAGG